MNLGSQPGNRRDTTHTYAFDIVRKLLLAALIYPLFITTSLACSCPMPGPPKQELAHASAVFSGTALELESDSRIMYGSADPIRVVFEVEKVWKGPNVRKLVVYTAREASSCGYRFRRGVKYLVYATGGEQQLNVSLCSRTTPFPSAIADLIKLGEP